MTSKESKVEGAIEGRGGDRSGRSGRSIPVRRAMLPGTLDLFATARPLAVAGRARSFDLRTLRAEEGACSFDSFVTFDSFD